MLVLSGLGVLGNEREAMFQQVNDWSLNGVKGQKFHGGRVPDLGLFSSVFVAL